jgi:DNA replication protein DnaC
MTYSTQPRGIGDPACPFCDGLGYVSYDLPDHHPDFGKMVTCECRQSSHYDERLQRLRKVGGLEVLADKRLETFNAQGIGLTDPERQSLQGAFDAVAAYAEQPQGWLVLRGGYGVGKTHLAAAIANRQLELGSEAVFVSVPDLLDHLRATYRAEGDETYDERFQQVRNTPLLILDDLGVESPTNWAVEKLYQIFNHRYNAHLPTVITTNHELEELERRLRSRLSDPDLSRVVTIVARDYRGGSGIGGHAELSSLGLLGHMRFETFDLREDVLSGGERDNLREAYETALAYAQEPRGWLLFFGPYGVGKTHLAAAISNARLNVGENVMFVTVPDLLDHLRATYSPDSPVSYDKRLAEIRNAPLLVLDDLGTESATPWAREKLYQVFNYRYNAALPTIITTAHMLEALDPRLSTRLLDRQRCTPFALIIPPYRGRNKRGQK